MKMGQNMIVAVVLIVVALLGGFFAGMHYQKSNTSGVGQAAYGQFRSRLGQNVRPIRGQVLSIDNTGITVKMTDGSSRIVVVSPSTVFVKSTTAAKTDVKTGDTVMIIGAQNSDGSVTAQNVQVNPLNMQREQMPSATPTTPAQ